jgi:hypothetical protein
MPIYSITLSQDEKFYVYEYMRNRKSKQGDIGTPYYVGKGFGNRAYRKHQKGIIVPKDKSNIRISTLMNEANAFQLKIHLYGRIDIKNGCLYNKTHGGDGCTGLVHTTETKQKLSKFNTGKKLSGETKRKMSVRMKNLSQETKDKINANRKGMIGKTHSVESKKKMSEKKIGKLVSDATKQKISNANKGSKHHLFGKTHSEKTKKKQSDSHKGKVRTAESIQKTLNTKRKNGILIGGTSESVKKGWETRRINKLTKKI